jgi:predicted Zn finger-like uncharacterized protein
MNVQCTHCSTVFRVDPRKVPSAGVRVRCSICRGVFEVSAPAGAAEAPSAEPMAPAAQQTPPPATPAPPAIPATPAPSPGPPAPPAAPAEAAPSPSPALAAPAVPQTSAAAAPAAPSRPAGASPFGAPDPGAKARRLARALVSDIVTYHPERRDRALADGTLKREFMEEIKKSWEEFVAQVGPETARGTTHFRDALNEVLAKGQTVF